MTEATTKTMPVEMLELEPIAQHPAPALQGSREVSSEPIARGPMADAIAWLRSGGTMAELREMLELQRQFQADEARMAYTKAMAEFKRNPPTILKDKHVQFAGRDGKAATDYWHATLGNVCEAIIEGLASVGISHSWTPEQVQGGIRVTCTLTHELGHTESISLSGPADATGNKNTIQQSQSTATYLSRYTLLMITGLAVKDALMPDDDGKAGGMPAGGDTEANIHPQLLLDARDASMAGSDALEAFLKALEEKWRRQLAPIMGSLKEAAELADKPITHAAPPSPGRRA